MTAVFVADLINNRLGLHDRGIGPTRGPGAVTPADADSELATRRQQLADLDRQFADDPDYVVRLFRDLHNDPTLTKKDVREWLDTWRFAFDDPDGFERAVTSDTPSRGFSDWFERLRAYLHVPPQTSVQDQVVIGELAQMYGLAPQIVEQIKPNKRQFETMDPAWVPLALAKLDEEMKLWPAVLEPFRRHADYASKFVYDGVSTYDNTRTSRVALFSDWGTGYYHSAAIAQQLAAARLPYTFHLGDVYYGGKQQEFDDYWTPFLEQVVANTELFGIAENHELYGKGTAYLKYFDALRNAKRTRQEGSYCCLRFAKHQIIMTDVNWNGRQSYDDAGCREWLRDVLKTGGTRTNILLTGSAPYCYGEHGFTSLFGQMREFFKDGQIQLWFWGDDHYCALFPGDKSIAPFIGSCIGHAGFPGSKQEAGRACWAEPLWVETGARFPKWTNLRQDVTNAGWVEMNLRDDGGVDLLYIDWLGAKRLGVTMLRKDSAFIPIGINPFPAREDGTPELWKPQQ